MGALKVHTNDLAPIYGRLAKKLGHASLTTVFRPGRLTFQPIPRENLESPVIRSQPITTSVITDACLNTRWHHGAYISPKDTGWLAWESRYVWIESWQCTWFSRRNERCTVATRLNRHSREYVRRALGTRHSCCRQQLQRSTPPEQNGGLQTIQRHTMETNSVNVVSWQYWCPERSTTAETTRNRAEKDAVRWCHLTHQFIAGRISS